MPSMMLPHSRMHSSQMQTPLGLWTRRLTWLRDLPQNEQCMLSLLSKGM
jgi:hypothetical protein